MAKLKKEADAISLTFLLKNAAAAAFSACVAETITMPLDTVKVRLQMQKLSSGVTLQ